MRWYGYNVHFTNKESEATQVKNHVQVTQLVRDRVHVNIKLWAVTPASPGGLVKTHYAGWPPGSLTCRYEVGPQRLHFKQVPGDTMLQVWECPVRSVAISYLEHSQNRPITGGHYP